MGRFAVGMCFAVACLLVGVGVVIAAAKYEPMADSTSLRGGETTCGSADVLEEFGYTLRNEDLNYFAVNADAATKDPKVLSFKNKVVRNGDTLTVPSGAHVHIEGLLVVEAGATIVAEGTEDYPIVFSGSGEKSTVLVLGGNPDSSDAKTFTDFDSAGLPSFNKKYTTGGQNVLKHVQFNGMGSHSLDLNGLTLVGLGTNNVVEDVKVDESKDDGIELFGGSVDLKRVVVRNPLDDWLDTDLGYSGTIQGATLVKDNAKTGHSLIEATSSAGAVFRNIHVIIDGEEVYGNIRTGYTGRYADRFAAGEDLYNIEGGSVDVNGKSFSSGTDAVPAPAGNVVNLDSKAARSAGSEAWAMTMDVMNTDHTRTMPGSAMAWSGFLMSKGSSFVMKENFVVQLDESTSMSATSVYPQQAQVDGNTAATTAAASNRYLVTAATGRLAGARHVDIYFDNADKTRVVRVFGC